MDKMEAELNPLLQHFVDTGFQVAESQFREEKEFCPQITLLAEDEDGVTIVPIICAVDILGGKNVSRVVAGLITFSWEGVLKQRPNLKLLAISIATDAWIKTMAVAEVDAQLLQGTFKPPSQSVGSTEAIIVQLILENEDRLYQWPYVKSGKEVVFSGKPVRNGLGDSFIRVLWPL